MKLSQKNLKNILASLTLLFLLAACGSDTNQPANVEISPNIKEDPHADGLTVTSFNIKWYGIGGRIRGRSKDERRDHILSKFFREKLSRTDVFVFQEIVDTKRLAKLVPNYLCSSYKKRNPRHQHIVICARKNLSVIFDTLYEMDLNNPGLRPAMVASIKLKNEEILKVYGVHLKAKSEESDSRIEQMNKLVEISSFDTPTLIIGDFNTYEAALTGKDTDDDILIDEILDDFDFVQVADGIDTYLGRFSNRQLDRAWGRNLIISEPVVDGPCREDYPFPYSKRGFFRQSLSDHCPISLTITGTK